MNQKNNYKITILSTSLTVDGKGWLLRSLGSGGANGWTAYNTHDLGDWVHFDEGFANPNTTSAYKFEGMTSVGPPMTI